MTSSPHVNDRRRLSGRDACDSLALSAQQKRQCLRDDAMGHVLTEAMQRSFYACQYWFRDERWNCSLGSYRLNILNKGKLFFENSKNFLIYLKTNRF